MLKLLTFSSLFPNAAAPSHGIFVETRLRELMRNGRVACTVVAPVPWFPSTNARFGEYARFARAPREEMRSSVRVLHPRYLVVPKLGWYVTPFLMALAARATIARVIEEGFDFDLIDAHYYYPDGVAAALLGRWFRKPVVITARGTDINLIPGHTLPRKMVLWAERQAAASITVSQALKDEMVRLGVHENRVVTLRNGVDLERFAPLPRADARARLGIEGRVLLSVGHLIERKGHHLVIEALVRLPEWRLVIVGAGPMEAALKALAQRLGVADRVRFEGAIDQSLLPSYYSAANVLVLASSREGMPNVVLEALACGTPVVATPIWGTPEVVAAPVAGRLTRARDAESIVAAVNDLSRNLPEPSQVREYAERFSWDATTRGLMELLDRAAHTTPGVLGASGA
jgi:teichuronic acid biosynthesis glycosyltransferase TuaC